MSEGIIRLRAVDGWARWGYATLNCTAFHVLTHHDAYRVNSNTR